MARVGNGPFALVCAGGVTQSLLLRLPALHSRLGPIRGVTFSAARRAQEILHTGYAVHDDGAFADCSAIIVSAPEPEIDAVVRTLPSQALVLICETERNGSSFAPLTRVATLQAHGEPAIFTAEGHADGVALLRRLFAEDRTPLVELDAGTRAHFFNGVQMSFDCIRLWMSQAVESMQAAGLGRPEAVHTVRQLAAKAARSSVRPTNPEAMEDALALLQPQRPAKVKAAHA
jgi:hypothetical protein